MLHTLIVLSEDPLAIHLLSELIETEFTELVWPIRLNSSVFSFKFQTLIEQSSDPESAQTRSELKATHKIDCV